MYSVHMFVYIKPYVCMYIYICMSSFSCMCRLVLSTRPHPCKRCRFVSLVVRYGALVHTATTHCKTLQHTATSDMERSSLLLCVAVYCNVLQCYAVCCSVLQCGAVCCSVV